MSEQNAVVQELERRLSIVEEIEAQIEGSLRRAERLRQAILKMAFEERLVLQTRSGESDRSLASTIHKEPLKQTALSFE